MGISRDNVIDFSKTRARAEAKVAVAALMAAIAALSGEIERLERILSYGK